VQHICMSKLINFNTYSVYAIHTVYTQYMQWMLVGSGRVYKQRIIATTKIEELTQKNNATSNITTFHGSLHFLPSAIDRS